ESIRRYDPSTQRSTAAIDQVTILPIRERLGQSGAPADPTLALEASVIDYFTTRRTPVYLVGELEQAHAVAETFLEQIAASFETVTATANKGAGPVAPPDRLFVSVEDIFGRLSNAVRLEELAIEEAPAELRDGPAAASETIPGAGSTAGPNVSSANVRHV